MDQDYALFAAVIDSGSLSAAGRRLHLSPAMVSKRLRRLEERLGARLINRTTRRLSPTAAGQAFHHDVSAILAAAAAAEARVSGLTAAPAGPLRISAPTSFGRLHIAPHLSRFLDRYPRVEVELQLEDGFVDLIGARIDLASVPVLPVFRWLAKAGAIAESEMLRTFNCGIGMVAVVEAERAEAVATVLAREGERVVNLGTVVEAQENAARVTYHGRLALAD